ncbi:MAG: tetratricopeptide repeat protein [Gammaproteobacteria bacterium]|nr:tetratricopeptide repeat protein [Gammaproteobacteria bacterium]
MNEQAPANSQDSLLRYVGSGEIVRRPITWLFFAAAIVFFASLLAGLGYFSTSHGGLPGLSLDWLEEGEQLFGAGDYERAALEFAAAVAVSPANTDSQVNLGAAEYARGNREAAIMAFRAVLRIEPEHAEANYFLGVMYLQSNRIDDAITLMRRSVASDPDRVAAWSDLGVAYTRRGDFQSAADSYQRALEIDPNFVAARRNLEALRRRMQGAGR